MSEAIVQTKRCTKCGDTKPAKFFSHDPRHTDGLQSQCTACRSKRFCRWIKTTHGRKIHRANCARWARTPKGKNCSRAKTRRYNAKIRHTNMLKARGAVNYAVKAGKIPRGRGQPCKECGKPASGYHHHLGYDPEHWLHVIPLCSPCHKVADATQ